MGIDNLPQPGSKFRLTQGVGNFAAKLRSATRYGSLKNVQNNVPTVVGALKPYEKVIRQKGGLSRLQERAVIKAIKQNDHSVTKEDVREIGKIMTHLRAGNTSTAAASTGQKRTAGGFFGGLFSTPKKEKPKPLPRYLRAARLEDDAQAQQMSQRTGISISQFRGGVSKVSVDTSAQGGRQNQAINPLTGQPTSGGIGRSGPSVGSSSGGGGGKPPMPLAN